MTPLALYAQRLRRRQAHRNQLLSQARTAKLYRCRRCDANFSAPPFISHKDGHTEICSDCSLIEDMDMKAPYDGREYWTIEQRLKVTAALEPSLCHPSAPCAVPAAASSAPQPAAV
jgi:hypothetical protein